MPPSPAASQAAPTASRMAGQTVIRLPYFSSFLASSSAGRARSLSGVVPPYSSAARSRIARVPSTSLSASIPTSMTRWFSLK